MGLIKRPLDLTKSAPDSKEWVDPDFLGEYPSLFAFVKDDKWADGSARLPGTITLFCKGGCLTMVLNDHDRAAAAYINAHTVNEMLFLADQGILNDSLDWKLKKPAQYKGTVPF